MATGRIKTVLGLLVVISIPAFVYCRLPFVLAGSIARDLSLSNTQIGLIGGLVFALFYAPAILPLPALADRWSPKMGVSYVRLALERDDCPWGLIGRVLAARRFPRRRSGWRGGSNTSVVCHDCSTSAAHRRAFAIGIFATGTPIGVMLGLALDGWIDDLASWRVALVAIGAPGLLVAAAFAFVAPDRQSNTKLH